MNAVLLSIQPQWCELIASGKKTIEVRKTKPKLDTPFKCYMYMTKDAKKRYYIDEYLHVQVELIPQKIIGEFVCDKIENIEIRHFTVWGHENRYAAVGENPDHQWLKHSCLSYDEIVSYGKLAPLYGWYISDLIIYDTPRELREFYFPPELYCEKGLCGRCPKEQVADCNGEYAFDCEWQRPLTRPPMSWCYIAPPGGECL